MRPLLWLLTPLLLLLLPLLRPRATARAVAKAFRSVARRVRKQIRTLQKKRQRRHKLRQGERAARERATAAAAAAAAKTAAHEAKQRERERVVAERAEAKARAGAAKADPAEPPKPAEAPVEAPAAKPRDREALIAERSAGVTPKQARKAAKQAKQGKDVELRNPEKAARAAAKAEARAERQKKGAGQPFWKTKAARARVKRVRRRWKLTKRGTRRLYNRRWRWSYKRTIDRVPARDELPALLNARGLLGQGVEIGVKTGLYSDSLLSNWKGAELISIDPWIEAEWEEYVDRSNVSQSEFNDNYEETKQRLSVHGERSTIWRLMSVEAAEKVDDHQLDFAYIDARHDYDSVLEDLNAWASKVKPGGILSGHDYVDGDLPQGEFFVKSAVDEFFGERGIPVHGTEGPSAVEMFPTWIVEVPEDGVPAEPTVEDFVKTPPPISRAAKEAAAAAEQADAEKSSPPGETDAEATPDAAPDAAPAP
jgi:hypothetical protein